MNTSRVYCPVTKCIEHVILFEREDGNNAVVYNLAALTFDQINTSKNNLSIELRKSGCYYLNKCDTIENQSTLLFAEEWDGISITSIKNNEVIDTTSCYNFSNSWSLLEFSELHGKMRVEQIKEDMTGREFTSLLFTDGLGREIKALSFDNMNQVSLYHVLKKVDKFRIGADPLHFCTPSFYYLYDKTLPFWLPGMDV